MFTFYDDIYKDEEKVWNLCYNELLGEFVTFYSWIPSYSENIDTQFFTFNRNTSKYLSLLNKCSYQIPTNTGVLLETPILTTNSTSIYYKTKEKTAIVPYTILNEDGTTTIKESSLETTNFLVNNIKFKVEKDHWGIWKYVNIDDENKLIITNPELFNLEHKVYLLYITPYLEGFTVEGNTVQTCFETETVAFTTLDKLNTFTNDFYLHGQAGIFNVAENLYPTYWYGEYHPFEFEVIVNDKIGQQKIFTDLEIISNKAEPESFHFEIEGDNYEFSSDKRNMYFRQEATKNLYQNLGSDIIYDRKYTDVIATNYTQEQYYRGGEEYKNSYNKFDRVYPIKKQGLVQQNKSTIFPLYYEKVDTYNEIYHDYREMLGGGYDFKNLSGSEIKWIRDLNQFNIVTHIKNSPIDLVGRLRGNSRYKEGKWNIQIPSIIFNQANEEPWSTYSTGEYQFVLGTSKLSIEKIGQGIADEQLINVPNNIPIPYLVINSQLPQDLEGLEEITENDLPDIYFKDVYNAVKTGKWTHRKEAKIRDKWMKIRVRYSGKNLAIIHSLITLYNISYA